MPEDTTEIWRLVTEMKQAASKLHEECLDVDPESVQRYARQFFRIATELAKLTGAE